MSAQLPKQLLFLIEKLSEDQLHLLYQIVVERVNLVHKARALYAMRNFHIMDRVSFHHNGRHLEGVITRLNQKTISITLDNGERWNVSPGSLTKLDEKNPLKEILTKEQWEKVQKGR